MTPIEAGTRPRVEGERELEILEATLEVLDEVGYDLLTMDAVATRAKASKATLYRRWKGKPELVVAAIMAHKGDAVVPDTGSLRGDLLAAYCGASGGLDDPLAKSVLSAVVTAMGRDRRSTSAPVSAARSTPTSTSRSSRPRWPGSSCTGRSCSARSSRPRWSAGSSTR